MTGAAFSDPVTRDQGGVVICKKADGSALAAVASLNYEEPTMPGTIQLYEFGTNVVVQTLTNELSSMGALALADVDGDGTLELFVGGRVVGGRYPEAPASHIYRQIQGKWQRDESYSAVLKNVGLVSGAVWSDLDGDGYPELILACEWGPVRVFQNMKGKLEERTTQLGMDKYSGWWNGVTTADFSGSGKLDIIASNWGLNTPYQPSSEASCFHMVWRFLRFAGPGFGRGGLRPGNACRSSHSHAGYSGRGPAGSARAVSNAQSF